MDNYKTTKECRALTGIETPDLVKLCNKDLVDYYKTTSRKNKYRINIDSLVEYIKQNDVPTGAFRNIKLGTYTLIGGYAHRYAMNNDTGEEDDGLIFTNTDIFIRRRLNQRGKYRPYQKFYINGIRTLYRATDVTNHKHLGYVFKMLPFINLEFNVLCTNPMEKDLSKIEFISLAEFCAAIDYDISQLNRLLNIYKTIKFDVNGEQEKFCAFTYDGIDRKSARIFVNPHILYNGTDYNRVKVLGAFCRD